MIVDYHMHLRAPDESINHSPAAVERFVEVARRRGVDEIGLSEHVYYFRQTREVWTVPYQSERCVYDLDTYCDAVLEAKRQGLPVKLGLEVDWVPRRADRLAEILAAYPWDYLLGSIHYLDGLALDSEPSLIGEVGVERGWTMYFDALGALAESGLVDVLAHPDLVKFFGQWLDDAGSVHGALTSRLSETGVCIEVSTAGRYKPHGTIYPDFALLELARQRGITITLASDAHVPDNVGRDLELAVEHARVAGYDTVTVFEGRARRQEPLG